MEKTNLNVSPYYDDFSESSNFHRVLFRPSYAVQARELTQLQTILQNQIERFGRHVFKEGSVVIPGSAGFTTEYFAIKLQSTYNSSNISGYTQYYEGKIIVGYTSGVKAEVIEVAAATTDDPITLFVKYISTGADNETLSFQDDEAIYATEALVDSAGTTLVEANIRSAQLVETNAALVGSSANVEAGVYFVRGHFVSVDAQRIILDKYTNTPSYRVGFTITESLETPEEDESLLDNAQGSTNLNAKGAHRLKFTLTLSKLALDSEEDGDFVELMRLENGNVLSKVVTSEYNILADTLARRTYDESGDYYVRKFDLNIKETLNDGLNDGVYNAGETTDSGNIASEDYYTIQISPGKAYVRGYEIETIAPKYIDVLKPRTFNTIQSATTPVEVGNFVYVTNTFGTPELSPLTSGEIAQPYRMVTLYDKATTTQGQAPSGGNAIGVARIRAFEHYEGNATSSDDLLGSSSVVDSTFKLYLFDLRMFTKITLSGTPDSGIVNGAKVTGQTTGAYGYVYSASGTGIVLIGVAGNFEAGENLSCSSFVSGDGTPDEIIEDSGNNNLTISSVLSYDFSSTKQVYMDDPDGSDPDFTADTVLGSVFTLNGSVSISNGSYNSGSPGTLSGSQTNFLSELSVGDSISVPSGSSGALQNLIILSITSEVSATVSGTVSNTVSLVNATRNRASLNDQNKNILIRKLQKNTIRSLKTEDSGGLSRNDVFIRKQFHGTTNTSGVVSFTLGSGETFVSKDNTDYILSVQTAGGGSAVAGDIINVNSSNVTFTLSSSDTTLTIGSLSLLGNAADIHLIATIRRGAVNEKSKTNNRCYMVLVENDGAAGGAEYGSSAHHKDISLGKGDVHRLRAIYESEDDSTNPVPPSWTYTSETGAFTRGELVTGQTTGAKATAIRLDTTNAFSFIPLNNISFQTGETIVGAESGETAILSTFTAGSKNVTGNYLFDTGQRDNFYDISRITRKSNASAPQGKLLIVCDYFSHGSGDFFTVDSYANQVPYNEIPVYTATRVDPEVREPTGIYNLSDCVDFRPKVSDVSVGTAVSIYGELAYPVAGYSFDFNSRTYASTNASVINIPKDNSNFDYDFEYYLPRTDSLYLKPDGNFVVATGAASENPFLPKAIDNAMKIADIFSPAYVPTVESITYNVINNRRYTMRDIGLLEKRIQNIEYYTALSLLENDAQTFEILDGNGLSRFKSGFVVDNFSGHSVGDPLHPDYRVSIDMENNELRPKFYMKDVPLVEEYATDAGRATRFYQKTGDLLTLPYENVVTVDQPYATRIENLNPMLFFTWTGECKLDPSEDSWFEVDRIPALIINQEGNFDTVLAQNENAIGTVWNGWQTQWTGSSSVATSGVFRSGWQMVRTITTTRTGIQTRTGIDTQVVEQIDSESLGDKTVSVGLVPFIRAKNINFTAKGMKPNTKVYPFFDKTNVTQYVSPSGGSFGGELITNAQGQVSGIFSIPNPKTSGNPSFRTGERIFRLSSSPTNDLLVETYAQAKYAATGQLETIQETIIATRNGRVVQTAVTDPTQTREVTDISTRNQFVRWVDPLAQSFLVPSQEGEFLTKVDVYFYSKDENIPVRLEVREMENGFPTGKILPFGSVILNPDDVSLSNDASVATTFTFDSPVYVNGETEYCIVLLADSKNYTAWISRMGERDISGNRLVSEQPYLGVLFKSQNNSTWSPYDFEDLKFKIYRADFDTTATGQVSYVNDTLPYKSLDNNPITTYSGEQYIRVSHKNHHMYNTSNNVEITGVSSGVVTSLSGSLTASSSSLTLSSASNFPTSGTVYVKINDEIISGTISGSTISSLTRGAGGTDAASHSDGDSIDLYMLNGIPLTEINKTHTGLMAGKIGMDYYYLSTTTAATSSNVGGGNSAAASENAMMNLIQTLLPVIEFPDTSVNAKIQTTSATSPSGTESSFGFQSSANPTIIPINDNYYFTNVRMVCSQVNEENEISGTKSFRMTLEMTSSRSNISPVIDTNRKSFVAIANRLNDITSSSDVFPASSYVFPSEPDGDNNDAIYVTRQVQLKTPATSIKLLFDAVRFSSSNIEAMYKILRSDDASDFDEIGWSYFNTNGLPDVSVNPSTTSRDFIEYEYTSDNLAEFISFAIKIRMRGTNTAEVPRIKSLRAIALAT